MADPGRPPQSNQPRRRDGPPLNVHSRAAAREQLRSQPGTGGVLADLHSLHDQQSRDMHAVFAATPREPASAYVSGHLTPTDQWVAVPSESSGVISLTSTDTEDDDLAPVRSHSQRPLPDPQPAAADSAPETAVPPAAGLDAEEQAVHLLRESVASLLSSTGSPASSSSALSPRRMRPPGGESSSGGGQHGWRQQLNANRRRSQSPSTVSKISEPCYLSSAPRRHFAAGFDHFSDIALSATAPPPQHPRARQSASHGDIWQHGPRADVTSPPPADQQGNRRPDAPLGGSSTEFRRRGAGSSGPADLSATGTTVVGAGAAYHHPLLASHSENYRLPIRLPASPGAARSPFASIRTVSPILIPGPSAGVAPCELDLLARAQAEAALEQTILCPLEQPSRQPDAADGKGAQGDGADGDGSGSARQAWARYTGYAIVGFGVGTLVGMMCFDMAAIAAPKATRTIPIVGV